MLNAGKEFSKSVLSVFICSTYVTLYFTCYISVCCVQYHYIAYPHLPLKLAIKMVCICVCVCLKVLMLVLS